MDAVKRVTTVDGRQVSYLDIGDGPTLILLHGWGSSSSSWSYVMERIASFGYRVITPDMPGFGETPPPSSVWGTKEYSEFVGKFANELDLRSFHLAGHSFGGATAAYFAATEPERVERLILMAAAVVRRKEGYKERILKYAVKPLAVVLYILPPNIRDNIKGLGYRLIKRRDYVKSYGIMREILQKVIREDVSETMLPNIKAKTLILWGELDVLTPIEDGGLAAELIPDSVMESYADVGHNLRSDIPKIMSGRMARFLSEE